MGCPINIWHCHFPLIVNYYFDLLIRKVMRLDVLLYFLSGIVTGSIINDDDSVVRVVLLNDGVHVVHVSFVCHVVVGGDNNTKGQFFIFGDAIFFFIIFLLLDSQL